MHIPDNYLSPSTCAVMGAAMVPVWTMAVKKSKERNTERKDTSSWYWRSFLIFTYDV